MLVEGRGDERLERWVACRRRDRILRDLAVGVEGGLDGSTVAPRRLWLAGSAFTALTAVSAISAAVFGLGTAEADSPPPAPPATPVSVAAVQASDVATWNEFSGRLEAVERVELRPRVPGTVQSVHFREGALVKQGELLITIDCGQNGSEARTRTQAESKWVTPGSASMMR